MKRTETPVDYCVTISSITIVASYCKDQVKSLLTKNETSNPLRIGTLDGQG